jgi:hypothetical protein
LRSVASFAFYLWLFLGFCFDLDWHSRWCWQVWFFGFGFDWHSHWCWQVFWLGAAPAATVSFGAAAAAAGFVAVLRFEGASWQVAHGLCFGERYVKRAGNLLTRK